MKYQVLFVSMVYEFWTQGKSCKSYQFSPFHLSFFLLCWSVLWHQLTHNTLIDDLLMLHCKWVRVTSGLHCAMFRGSQVSRRGSGCLRLRRLLGTIKIVLKRRTLHWRFGNAYNLTPSWTKISIPEGSSEGVYTLEYEFVQQISW